MGKKYDRRTGRVFKQGTNVDTYENPFIQLIDINTFFDIPFSCRFVAVL
jgi:hypothetical protein